MLIPAVAAFFKYKLISNIIILACGNEFEQIQLVRQLSQQGLLSTVSCKPSLLDQNHSNMQGVLYILKHNNTLLDETVMGCAIKYKGLRAIMAPLLFSDGYTTDIARHFRNKIEHFSKWNKWLIIGDQLPEPLHRIRYDADVSFLEHRQDATGIDNAINSLALHQPVYFEDVYAHPRDGASRHPWAVWTPGGFYPRYELERLRRRLGLRGYPMRIATPIGHYEGYNGSFAEYVLDNSQPERDSAIRCGYGVSSVILEWLRAEEVIAQVETWSAEVGDSMFTRLANGTSELSGGILRLQHRRLKKLDYVIPIWPFKVGFTYISERQSSSSMFVMPFSGATWAACAAIAVVLAIAQRVTAESMAEKDGALIAVLATWLQQDASAVPEGASGRLTFIMLSVCSMLVYAYYTSAIVSALMSAGGGGPSSLRALADSGYSLASEDYDWIRFQMFDVFKPDWPEMEYLKRKKLSSTSAMSKFYIEPSEGMRLVKQGSTAYHAEYNHVYPHMRILSDDQVCKLQYVHTIEEIITWLVTTKRGQWTEILRIGGTWTKETGLVKRVVSRWQNKPLPCRTALLAERVSYGDVAPLIILTTLGFVASIVLLFIERSVAKWRFRRKTSVGSDVTGDEEIIE